jgi:tRNA-modifying protein YgfZ
MTDFSYPPQILPNRAVIRVAGDGTLAFLHNLLTCDVEALAPGQAAYGALLSPQGKILHDVFVMATTDGALIDCAREQSEDLLQKLVMYRLRAKLVIAMEQDLQVAVSQQPMDGGFADPRLAAMGFRAIVAAGVYQPDTGYDAARVALGLADSAGDIGSNELFPHEANFDQLHAVSFTKGCYVGQEVVSRMQHRGTARNRILPVMFAGIASSGAAIQSGDTVIGEILSASGGRALALVRLDRLADAKAPLLSGPVRIHVIKPNWVSYDVAIPEVAQ